MAIKLRFKLSGMRKLGKEIKKIIRKTEPGTVVVVYEAHYATLVHENVGFPYRNGQPKYLETVYFTRQSEISEIFERVSKKRGLFEGMRMAAKFVLEESQKLVPVDTGNLKNSGKLIAKKEQLRVRIPAFKDIETD